MRKKISGLNQSVKIHLLFLWGVIAMFSSSVYAEKKTLPKPIFKLIKGQGTEVCEAYLQRLNATEFLDNNPFKGKISEPLLEGFVDLKPVPLTEEEIKRLYYKIQSFNFYKNQDLIEKDMETHKKLSSIRDAREFPKRIKDYMIEHQKTPLVHYQKKLDMDNNGTATNNVIKGNYGVYIMDKLLQRIDEENTTAIFADKELLEWPTITQFPPLAMPMNIFNYKRKYYFDGFLDLIFYNYYHEVDFTLPFRLGVFIHQHKHTQKVCEYQWINNPKIKYLPYPHYFL
jgi:hypothetical protein